MTKKLRKGINTNELHEELSEYFRKFKTGKVNIGQMSAVSNMAGKFISNARAAQDNAKFMGTKPNIPFFDVSEE